MRRGTGPSITGRILLVAGGCAAALFLLEMAMRLLEIQPAGVIQETRFTNQRLGKLGIRDRYSQIEKPEGCWRIIVLGDSFTYGADVERMECYVKQAECLIQAEVSPRVQVWNCGSPGWDTEREVRFLEEKGLSFDPDLVTICFCLNDATDWTGYDEFFQYYRRANEDGRLDRISYLYRWIHKRWLVWSISRRTTQLLRRSCLGLEEDGSRWEACRRALRRAQQLCEDRQILLTVMIFPMLADLEDYPFRDIHRTVTTYCESLEIPVLDLLPTFEGRRALELRNRIDDAHPNPRAHALAAESYARWLIDHDFVRPAR